MSIHGSLQSISIMELFSSLLQWGKTGVLTILSEKEERGFLFSKGNLVYATSRDSARRLGAFLVRLGHLTAEELGATLGRSHSAQGHLGQHLLDEDRITASQLRHAVKAQLLDIFLEVLGWEKGAFVFDDYELPFRVQDRVLNSTQRLLLEAATKMDERASRLAQALPAAEPGSAASESLPIFEASWAVPEMGGTTVAPEVPSQIFAIGDGDAFEECKICDVLAREPMLLAKVLKVLALGNVKLNRDELGIPSLVERLGAFNTRCLLLPEAVRSLYFPRSGRYWRECWEHDQLCAYFCERIAVKTGYSRPGEAYLAGLLHNLGVYVLLTNNPEEYRRVVTTSLATEEDIEGLEKRHFGISHTRLGGVYAKRWKFPAPIRIAIKDHHRVGRTLSRPLLHMLRVADYLTYRYGYRVGFSSFGEEDFRQSLEALDLEEATLAPLFDEAPYLIGATAAAPETETARETEPA
jgi:hypothetical protein